MFKKFVVAIDTQIDFIMGEGKLPVPYAEEIIIPGLHRLLGYDYQEVAGVLFTYDTHDTIDYRDSEEGLQFPIHCVKWTPGWRNVFDLDFVIPYISRFTMNKSVFDMWEESELILRMQGIAWKDRDEFFKELQKNNPNIVIEVWGVAGDVCVKHAVAGFLQRGFNVEVVDELTKCIADVDADTFFEDEFPDAFASGQLKII